MSKVSLWRSAGLAALAAGAALMTAVPAQAQDRGRGHGGWQHDSSGAAADGQRSGGDWQARRQAQQEQRGGGDWQARRQAQQEQRGGGDWQARRQAQQEQRGGGDWQARRQAQQEQRAAQVQQQQAVPDGGWRSRRGADEQRGAWRERTQAPVVINRDRTDRNWSNSQRGDAYRNTYRGVIRQDGRQAYRNDGYRDDGRRDGYRHDYHGGSRGWDNGWRRDRRYDWQGYRNSNRDAFRLGRYYSPYRNYSYRRLSIGLFLEPLFYSNNYWIDEPWQYRLPEVYGPYRWVRYYDDVLLIDIYSGEVVDAIYDFFD